ncbi:MAG: hypothetical protein PF450_09855 [Bacteroidales bacterium]|nr:hypothetical protein [Bacteroidales bacterium]
MRTFGLNTRYVPVHSPVRLARILHTHHFDIGKNYAEMLPLRVKSEETFRGHFLLIFMTTVFYKLVQDRLKPTDLTPQSMFLNLRNHKCKVYDRAVIPQKTFKKANDSYKMFKIRCPVEIEY